MSNTTYRGRRAVSIENRRLRVTVLIKGGHLRGEQSIDLLNDNDDVSVFRGELIQGAELHGSGCVLSAAIAAGLCKGMRLSDAVRNGKRFVTELLRLQTKL